MMCFCSTIFIESVCLQRCVYTAVDGSVGSIITVILAVKLKTLYSKMNFKLQEEKADDVRPNVGST